MWTSTLRRLRGGDFEVVRALQAIEHAVSIERRLIEDLVEVSRLERGTLELLPEPIDLRTPTRAAIEAVRGALEESGVSLTEELPSEPVPVVGDPARLLQVVRNLLGNAAKFTPRDGAAAIRLRREGERAHLRVSDTGPGLPPEVGPRLFMPFVQGPNAHGGLGVGLAVARRLVELHGGALEACGPGDLGGTTMVVTLPLGTVAEETARADR
jgi:signal transduction histidine kinase